MRNSSHEGFKAQHPSFPFRSREKERTTTTRNSPRKDKPKSPYLDGIQGWEMAASLPRLKRAFAVVLWSLNSPSGRTYKVKKC